MAQMNGGAGRKDGLKFIHHVFHEAERFRTPHADGVPPLFPLHGKVHAVANQIPVGMHGRIGMAGKVYFRNNGDLAAARIGNDLPHLLLGVKTAVGFSIVSVAAFVGLVVSADDGLPAYGPDLGQQGIAFDLDAPSLVVCQMPVEYIEME